MRRTRVPLWTMRVATIAFFTFAHLAILTAFSVANLGGLLERGPRGEELGGVYRESAEGLRNRAILEVLSWPIERPVSIVDNQLSGSTSRSTPWRTVKVAGFYGNSIVWGIGLWLLLECLGRGIVRFVRRR